ncbi:hypothetical protein ACFYM3_05975 [Streptomyces massasporeus]|uniref:Uncharacterized protein n=1 Tax=Streptomyces massasporeus TaxID=67324 RepID=A0ABW6L6R1_9ACTN
MDVIFYVVPGLIMVLALCLRRRRPDVRGAVTGGAVARGAVARGAVALHI